MPSLKEVVAAIETFAPIANQEEWDNCGLLFGSAYVDVKRVLLTLDLTPAVAAEAVSLGVDMIIEHHPSIFQPINTLARPEDGSLAAFVAAVRHGIAVYAAHTSVDNATGGLNDYVLELLGGENLGSAFEKKGFPKLGRLNKPLCLSDLVEEVKNKFGDEHVRFVGDPKKMVQTYAITNGCGASYEFLSAARDAGADVFITGDVKYHLARWTADANYAIISFGHYESERGFAALMKNALAPLLPGVEFILSEKCFNPYS